MSQQTGALCTGMDLWGLQAMLALPLPLRQRLIKICWIVVVTAQKHAGPYQHAQIA